MEGVQFTGTGMTIGTPDYMAPEQGGGARSPAVPTSIPWVSYSTKCCAGELPFTADTPVAVLLKHISDEPPSIRMRAPDLPSALDLVLERALAKDPGDRYPSASALVKAVEQALETNLTPPGGE